MKKPKRAKTSRKRAPKKKFPDCMDARHMNWQRGLGAWFDQVKKRIVKMRRDQIEEKLLKRKIITKADIAAKDLSIQWLRYRLAVAYQEERRHSFGSPTPPKVQERIDRMHQMRRMENWYVDIFTGRSGETRPGQQGKGGSNMPKKETIGSYMVTVLRRKTVPTNAAIVEMVKERFPDSAFKGAHVSWYKGAFNAGKLPGQEGKGESFNQPKVREGATTKKKVSKKKTSKKKVAKKKVAKKTTKKKATSRSKKKVSGKGTARRKKTSSK